MTTSDQIDAKSKHTVVYNQKIGDPDNELRIQAIAGTTEKLGWWAIKTTNGEQDNGFSLSQFRNGHADPNRVIEFLAKDILQRIIDNKSTQPTKKRVGIAEDLPSDKTLQKEAAALARASEFIDMDQVHSRVQELLAEQCTTDASSLESHEPQPVATE